MLMVRANFLNIITPLYVQPLIPVLTLVHLVGAAQCCTKVLPVVVLLQALAFLQLLGGVVVAHPQSVLPAIRPSLAMRIPWN